MAATLLLDRALWDLAIDARGNIAVAAEPYSLEQDVASECRVYAGECYFDTARGVPYATAVLGQMQPVDVLKEKLVAAAKRVPGVNNPRVFLNSINAREITGQVQFEEGIVAL